MTDTQRSYPFCSEHGCENEADFHFIFAGQTTYCCTTHQVIYRQRLTSLGYQQAFDPEPFNVLWKAAPADVDWRQLAEGYKAEAEGLRGQLGIILERQQYWEAECSVAHTAVENLKAEVAQLRRLLELDQGGDD